MNAETLARLTREAEAPEGIAVRVSGPEMKRLLEERVECLAALNSLTRVGNRIVLSVPMGDNPHSAELARAVGAAIYALSRTVAE